MITPDELHELFHYNPETGQLIWKVAGARRRKPGDVAGCIVHGEKGRITIGIRGKLYRAHRIIWAMQTGSWPDEQIDHINEDPSDNRWENLRAATKAQNMRNITLTKANTSGHKGVGFDKQRGKWRAYIKVDGVTYHLGLFDTKEDAIKARVEASERLHGAFAKH